MASNSGAGGSRRGAGRKRKKFDVAQGQRTVAIRLETSIYERWVDSRTVFS